MRYWAGWEPFGVRSVDKAKPPEGNTNLSDQTNTALAWPGQLIDRPLAWAVLLLTGVGLEAAALWFQYAMELQPCVYCIYIRLAVVGIIAAALVGLIGAILRNWLRWLGIAGWGFSAGYGIVLSWQLYKIQNPDPDDALGGCSFLPNFPDWLPLHQWLPSIFMPTGSCIDEPWSWLGLSMAQWTAVAFACYLLAWAVVLAGRFIAPKMR